jgi:transposase
MRKVYDRDFKLKVSRDIKNGSRTVTEVAGEFGISRPIVSRWLAEFNRYGNKAFTGHGNKLPDRAKIHAYEAEIKRLKEENEILKKFEVFVKHEKK